MRGRWEMVRKSSVVASLHLFFIFLKQRRKHVIKTPMRPLC